MASIAAIIRSLSAAGTRLRFLRALLLSAIVQIMAELFKGYELALAKILAAFPDCSDFLGRWLFFREFRNPVFYALGIDSPNVVAKRFPHEFGACAVLFLSDTLKLVRHLGRH